MSALLQALESSPPATWLRTATWAYPALEIVHILALGAVVGSLLLVDLAVLRGRGAESLQALADQALPVTWVAFAVAAASGLAMFASRAGEFGYSRVLWIKLALIALAGINAAVFHLRGSLRRGDPAARLQALLSLGLWTAVVGAGRLIAYL